MPTSFQAKSFVLVTMCAVLRLGCNARSALDVTRQSDTVACSVLMNAASTSNVDGNSDLQTISAHATTQLLSFASSNPMATSSSTVTHYPAVAVVGGNVLVDEEDLQPKINLSPAIQIGDEICFMAMSDDQPNGLETECRFACTRLTENAVSMSYHGTAMGELPFLFVGESTQAYADCKEIVYPEHRTQLGWMCKSQAESSTNEEAAQESFASRSTFGMVVLFTAFALALSNFC